MKKHKTWIAIGFAIGFYLLSKALYLSVFDGIENLIVRNLLSLGVTHSIFIAILTSLLLKYRKSNTVKELKVLYTFFYFMSIFQVLVYFGYAYSLSFNVPNVGVWFMDARNGILAIIICLFTIDVGTYIKLKDVERVEETERELKEFKEKYYKLIEIVSRTVITEDLTELKNYLQDNA